MKRLLTLSLLLSAFAFSAVAQTKIATIDLRKVFDNYYKTKQADANLKDEAGDMDKQRKEMIDELKKGEQDWKTLLDKANDQAVAKEERDKSKESAEKKFQTLKDLEQGIAQFDKQARTKLGEKQKRLRDKILEEIREIINKQATSNSYALVVDIAAESRNDTPIVLYTNGENDITQAVLTALNASVPASATGKKDEKAK